MFLAQLDRDRSENTDHVPGLLSASVPSESSPKKGVGKVETKPESRTQAEHDVGELLCLQTEQKV